jgi:hypothetical protein
MLHRAVLQFLALSCLATLSAAADQAPKPKTLPLLPPTTPQGVEGGFWRTDAPLIPYCI